MNALAFRRAARAAVVVAASGSLLGLAQACSDPTGGSTDPIEACADSPAMLDDSACDDAPAPCSYDADGCPTVYACAVENHALQWIASAGAQDGDACASVGKACVWDHSFVDGGPYRRELLDCTQAGWRRSSCSIGFDATTRS